MIIEIFIIKIHYHLLKWKEFLFPFWLELFFKIHYLRLIDFFSPFWIRIIIIIYQLLLLIWRYLVISFDHFFSLYGRHIAADAPPPSKPADKSKKISRMGWNNRRTIAESQIQTCPYRYMYMSKAIALSKTPGVIVDLIDQVILHETCGCLWIFFFFSLLQYICIHSKLQSVRISCKFDSKYFFHWQYAGAIILIEVFYFKNIYTWYMYIWLIMKLWTKQDKTLICF